MTDLPASAIVTLTGIYFLGLGCASMFMPAQAARFLLGFAGSASAHYLELLVRLVVGWAFLLHAPEMRYSVGFVVAGWVILVTTAGLLVVPWRWHHAFAQRAVPLAVRHIRLVGMASLVLGGVVLAATAVGAA